MHQVGDKIVILCCTVNQSSRFGDTSFYVVSDWMQMRMQNVKNNKIYKYNVFKIK